MALFYVLLIYALLPVTPPLMRSLRALLAGTEGLRWAMIALIGVIAAGAIGLAVRRGASGQLLHLTPILAALLVIAWWIGQPQRVFHVPEYALAALLIGRALPREWPRGLRRAGTLSLTTHVAMVDEIIQYYLPMRTFDPADIGLDLLGALLGVVAADLVSVAGEEPAGVGGRAAGGT